MIPTEEQKAILAAARQTARARTSMKIAAGPGTGKTATLLMIAEDLKRVQSRRHRVLYLAYNAPLKREAQGKFGDLAEVRTVHGLAYKCMRVGRCGREVGRSLRVHHVRDILGLPEDSSDGGRARYALQVLRQFLNSEDVEITSEHVPASITKKNPEAGGRAVSDAREVFEAARVDQPSQLPLPHDIYLKTWHVLGTPGFDDYDTVLLDEAQDANGAIISAVEKAPHLISVGDTHQQIYAWRGAVNAMTRLGGTALPLTLSFRFGPAIAEAANHILDLKANRDGFRLRGSQNIDSTLGRLDVTHPHARLYRTNAAALEDLVFLEDIGRRPALVGDVVQASNTLV